jgi:hypothetical protein
MPHVFGGFALQELVELLVSITLPVVEVSFVETIAIILTEKQILFKVFKHCLCPGITTDLGLAHDYLLY